MLRNGPTKHWAFSEKTQIGKIRNFWNEKTFFLFPTVCIFDFCENMNLRLHILFLVDNLWRNNEHMFWELLETCYWKYDRFSGFSKFRFSERNTENRCHIYILKKKVIILRKIHVTMKSFAPPFSTIERN